MISVEVKNVDGVLASFKGYEKESAKAIKKAIDDTARALETDAKRIIQQHLMTFHSGKTKGSGTLLTSIHKQLTQSGDLAQLEPLEGCVGSNVKYAPYWEFGIGDFVNILPGWESIAIKFKGKKKVRGFKGCSFIGNASIKQAKEFPKRVYSELGKIKFG